MGALEEIETALDMGDTLLLDDAVAKLRTDNSADDGARLNSICRRLCDQRKFDHLATVADAAIQQGHGGPMWSHLVQALVEHGANTAAAATIQQALNTEDVDDEDRTLLLGHLGRIAKDRYLATRDPRHLQQAIDAYVGGVRSGGDLLWHGVNAHALTHLAQRRGIAIQDLGIGNESELFEAAERAHSPHNHWSVTTKIEASLLVGLPIPLDTIVNELQDASPFVIGSLRRQLLEVWDLPADHPAIVTLAELSLRKGGADEVVLPANEVGYEKMFGSEWPIPLETYKDGLRVAGSVCHLLVRDRFTAGTGFVLNGGSLHPSLVGRQVIITNEHVVPSAQRGGVTADELTAKFDAHASVGIDDMRAVWWSDREDLDITVLVSDALDASAIPSLEPTLKLPPVRQGAYVYVVGHPGGAGLQLSIRGNQLLDQDGTRIHYLAPTSKGSSGSPVFDDAWRLIGVHHYGSPRLPALNNKSGTYDGNEGTSMAALRLQIEQRPPQR